MTSDAPARPGWPRADALVAIALAGLAILLRLAVLGDRQLFRDEGASWYVTQYGVGDLIAHVRAEPYAPLYHLLLKAWIAVAGDTEAALRLPSAVAGIATVLIGWRWAHESLGRRAGLVALGLLAVSPLALANARDVRMYALETLWATLGWWMVWRIGSGIAGGRRRRLALVLLAFAVAAETWTFSYGLVIAGLQLIVVSIPLVRRRTRADLAGPLAVVAGAASFLPWLPSLLDAGRGQPFWTPVPPAADLVATFTTLVITSSPDRFDVPFVAAAVVLAVAALGIAASVGRARPRMGDPRVGPQREDAHLGMVLLGALALIPLVWVVSQVHSVYDARYFGACVPPAAIAAAAGSRWLAARRSGRALAIPGPLIAGVLVAGSITWLGDWKAGRTVAPAAELLAALEARMAPGDVAVALDARSYFQLAYLLGREMPAGRLPGPLYSWNSEADPFYWGQALLEDTTRVRQATVDGQALTDAFPGLAPTGRIWLITLRQRTTEPLRFAPLERGEVAEIDRLVIQRGDEVGQLIELARRPSADAPAR